MRALYAHILTLTGTPDSKAVSTALSSQAMEQAMAAVEAWGCYAELLGESFLTRDPPVGQPMLKVSLPFRGASLSHIGLSED